MNDTTSAEGFPKNSGTSEIYHGPINEREWQPVSLGKESVSPAHEAREGEQEGPATTLREENFRLSGLLFNANADLSLAREALEAALPHHQGFHSAVGAKIKAALAQLNTVKGKE